MVTVTEDDEAAVLAARVPLPESDKEALVLTLNRPVKRNCFDARLCRELATAFRDAAEEVRSYDQDPIHDEDEDEEGDSDEDGGRRQKLAAIILTGAGSSFCAGADLSNPPNPLHQSSDLPHHLRWNPVHQMGRVGVPIIGALRGHVSLFSGWTLLLFAVRSWVVVAH